MSKHFFITFSIFFFCTPQYYGQSNFTQITVLEKTGLKTAYVFKREAKSINFNLIEKIVNTTDTSYYVALSVSNEGEVKVGSTSGMGVNSNLDVSFGNSAIKTFYKNDGYLELNASEFAQVFTFINNSMGKANPKQELETAIFTQFNDRFKIALIYDGEKWSYRFQLDDAEYEVELLESINTIMALKSMNHKLIALNSTLKS